MTKFDKVVAYRLDMIRDLAESGDSHLTGQLRRDVVTGDVIGRIGGLNIPELIRAGVTPKRAAEAIRRGRGVVYDRIVDAVAYGLEKDGYKRARPRSPGRPVVPPHQGNAKCIHCQGAHSTGQHRFHGPGSFHQTHLFAFNPPGKLVCPKCGRPLRIQTDQGRRYGVCQGCRVMLVSQAPPAPPRSPNPPKRSVQIYQPTAGVVIQGMQKPPGHPCDPQCRAANHKYRHRFKSPVEVLGRPNGDVLLRGRKGRR